MSTHLIIPVSLPEPLGAEGSMNYQFSGRLQQDTQLDLDTSIDLDRGNKLTGDVRTDMTKCIFPRQYKERY